MAMVTEERILDDLMALIVAAVPELGDRVVYGPIAEPPLELALVLEYGDITIAHDGMEVATHQLTARVALPWQPGSPLRPAHRLLSERMRLVYAAIPPGSVLGPNQFLIVTGPYVLTHPRVGIERPAQVDNIVWAGVTFVGESKEGYL